MLNNPFVTLTSICLIQDFMSSNIKNKGKSPKLMRAIRAAMAETESVQERLDDFIDRLNPNEEEEDPEETTEPELSDVVA